MTDDDSPSAAIAIDTNNKTIEKILNKSRVVGKVTAKVKKETINKTKNSRKSVSNMALEPLQSSKAMLFMGGANMFLVRLCSM